MTSCNVILSEAKNLYAGALINPAMLPRIPCRFLHTQRFFAPAKKTPPGSE
jgi:hypothetical protein